MHGVQAGLNELIPDYTLTGNGQMINRITRVKFWNPGLRCSNRISECTLNCEFSIFSYIHLAESEADFIRLSDIKWSIIGVQKDFVSSILQSTRVRF